MNKKTKGEQKLWEVTIGTSKCLKAKTMKDYELYATS